MNKNKKHDKRNQLDIILTDLQPNEVPQIYTLKNFYNYLVTNKVMKRISRDKNEDEKNRFKLACGTFENFCIKG